MAMPIYVKHEEQAKGKISPRHSFAQPWEYFYVYSFKNTFLPCISLVSMNPEVGFSSKKRISVSLILLRKRESALYTWK